MFCINRGDYRRNNKSTKRAQDWRKMHQNCIKGRPHFLKVEDFFHGKFHSKLQKVQTNF